jgi:Fur family transcriptional regulator, peroxide stress response regulator
MPRRLGLPHPVGKPKVNIGMKRPTCKSDCPGEDEAHLRHALEKAGWRMTRQRAEVFAYLRRVECHPTAEQVFTAVRTRIPKLSLATVYKALEALVDVGLAGKLTDLEGRAHYDGRSDAHYHFRCAETGEVHDLPIPYDPTLLDKVAPGLVEQLRCHGYQVTGHRLELIGALTPTPVPRAEG